MHCNENYRQEGTIGDDIVVRPPPVRLRKKFSRLKRDFPQSNRYDLEYTYYHVAYRRNDSPIHVRDSTSISRCYIFFFFFHQMIMVFFFRNWLERQETRKKQKQALWLRWGLSTAENGASPNSGHFGLRHVPVRSLEFSLSTEQMI